MSYEINDRTLIEEMCGDIRNTAQAEYKKYGLPKSDASYFNIDLSHVGTSKEEYKEKIESKISKQMYYRDLKID